MTAWSHHGDLNMKSVSRRSFVTLLGTSAASAPILFNTIGSAVASVDGEVAVEAELTFMIG